MLAAGLILRRCSIAVVLVAAFPSVTKLTSQTPTGNLESASLPGSTQSSAISVEYRESIAHRLGDLPVLRVTERQAIHWSYDDFAFQLTVSPAGEVADATLKSNPPSDMPSTVITQATQFIRAMHFRPFERDGKPVWATLQDFVLLLPPERLPTTHLPFPEYEGKPAQRKSLLITLQRTVCYGTCPAYVLRIHGDGKVEFDAQRYVAAEGRHTAVIDQKTVDALVDQFRNADFFSLSREYRYGVTDNPTYIVSISIGGKTRQVIDYVGEREGMPAVVTRLEKAIDKAANAELWINGDPAKPATTPVE